MRCRELVQGSPDLERLKLSGGVTVAVMAGVGMAGGFLGSLAFGFAAAAVGSVLMSRSFRYRCTGCGTVVPERVLIEGERSEVRDRKSTLLIRAGLMAVASLVAGFLWVHAALATAKAPPGEDIGPDGAPGAESGPDVAALERAHDADALAALVERDPLHREAAAAALGRLGDNAVPALLPVLTRGDEHGKRSALVVLKRLAPKTDRALDALVAFVGAESSPWLRAQAIDVLGLAGPSARRALPRLEPLLGDYQLGGTTEDALRRIAPETDWKARRKALRQK